jgi:hypothetical protein
MEERLFDERTTEHVDSQTQNEHCNAQQSMSVPSLPRASSSSEAAAAKAKCSLISLHMSILPSAHAEPLHTTPDSPPFQHAVEQSP